jgi:hypothetical protein
MDASTRVAMAESECERLRAEMATLRRNVSTRSHQDAEVNALQLRYNAVVKRCARVEAINNAYCK